MIPLSKNLVPIYEYELALGNEEAGRYENAWTKCPLEIIFKYPLHFQEIERDLILSPSVER